MSPSSSIISSAITSILSFRESNENSTSLSALRSLVKAAGIFTKRCSSLVCSTGIAIREQEVLPSATATTVRSKVPYVPSRLLMASLPVSVLSIFRLVEALELLTAASRSAVKTGTSADKNGGVGNSLSLPSIIFSNSCCS